MIKTGESGRSMIEMLGVLAIIGVLSVGGIAGYSKAMTKYRENKTIDQVSHIAANVRILFGSQKNYAVLGGRAASGGNAAVAASTIIDGAKLFPSEMGSGGNYTNPFAGTVTIAPSGRFTSGDNKAFILTYNGIPTEACIDLATIDWNTGSGGGMVAMGVNANLAGNVTGSSGCGTTTGAHTGNDRKSKVICEGQGAMSVTNAVDACDGTNDNVLSFKFY